VTGITSTTIDARLFFADGPRYILVGLCDLEIFNQLRPLDSCLDRNPSTCFVEIHDMIEVFHAQEQHAVAELLAPHGMASPGQADGAPSASGVAQRYVNVVDRTWIFDFLHSRGVQLRLDVVNIDALAPPRSREKRGRRRYDGHSLGGRSIAKFATYQHESTS
jgi:hypothetical protein